MLTLDNLNAQDILERVDEYSLYCFYLEFEPVIGRKYQSRLRTRDDRPSFGLFERRYGGDLPHEFLWKDQALPCMPNYGDIFDLLIVLYKGQIESRYEAMFKVASDFGLMEQSDVLVKQLVLTPIRKGPAHIRVKSRPFDVKDIQYWQQYNIEESILRLYNCTAVEYFFLFDTDITPRSSRGRMYAYRIFDKYQLYQPKPKEFFMDWTDTCIPGFQQLCRTDLLIITKAYKDVMFFRSLGYDAIAPRAENMIPDSLLIEWVQKRYKRVVTFFDNDGKTSPHLYPFKSLEVPLDSGTKDPTDYCARYGPLEADSLIKDLLHD
jgi:hypothetical protein